MNYQYTLEKYTTPSSRYTCPSCGQRRRFTRYVDTATGAHLADHVGRCDRQDSCGYHYSPRDYFRDHAVPRPSEGLTVPRVQATPAAVIRTPSLIPDELMDATEHDHLDNNLLLYLLGRYPRETVYNRIGAYHIGTSQRWPGATVFWQMDAQGDIRTGKVMLYDLNTGRRVKEPVTHISWMHRELAMPDYHLVQCLYGEHLINMNRDKPIAVTESEKTAIIASIHMPQYYWLATGGKEGLTAERMAALAGRRVMLYPDVGCYELWRKRATALKHIAEMQVSNLLERLADAGRDIADFA